MFYQSQVKIFEYTGYIAFDYTFPPAKEYIPPIPDAIVQFQQEAISIEPACPLTFTQYPTKKEIIEAE